MIDPVDIPLRMQQGVPFTHVFTWDVSGDPVALPAGSTADFVMREGFRSPVAVALDEADGITLHATDGTITVTFTPDMPVMRYRYALFVTPLGGERTKLVASHADVYPDESAAGGGAS